MGDDDENKTIIVTMSLDDYSTVMAALQVLRKFNLVGRENSVAIAKAMETLETNRITL